MPVYKYVCESCSHEDFLQLPISTDPNKLFCCTSCSVGDMSRRIMAFGTFNKGRQTLGKWYKENTGKEFMEGADRKN